MNPTDYPFFISPLTEEDGGGFFIAFPDLPGCISDGETAAEAIKNGYDAARAWLETAKEFSDPIPQPSTPHGGLMMGVTQKPSWLHEKQIALPNGQEALWSYDTESDFLEIFFRQQPATATIELADGVYLRFNRQKQQALSLGFVGITPLTQEQEFGLPLLSLDGLHNLPQQERQVILKMLQSPPLNTFFTLYSWTPPSQAQVLPVASFAQPILLAA